MIAARLPPSDSPSPRTSELDHPRFHGFYIRSAGSSGTDKLHWPDGTKSRLVQARPPNTSSHEWSLRTKTDLTPPQPMMLYSDPGLRGCIEKWNVAITWEPSMHHVLRSIRIGAAPCCYPRSFGTAPGRMLRRLHSPTRS